MGPTATAPLPMSADAPQAARGGAALPRISIVTPSFNQGSFLRETLQSILSQGYPDLEYVVVDGGSTDESSAIIREHEKHLAWWVSEKDAGQYDAINKGFARTTGEVMAWLNSDDKYTPWALAVVGEIFAQLPEVQWLTTLLPLHWDARGVPTKCKPVHGYTKDGFFRGQHLQRPGEWDKAFIQQESTFWRRSLWEKAGGKIDASLQLAGDFELWAKFYQHADLYGVPLPLGGFRMHGDQKTAHRMESYIKEAEAVLARYGGRVEPPWRPRPSSRWYRRFFAAGAEHKMCVYRDGHWTQTNQWLAGWL